MMAMGMTVRACPCEVVELSSTLPWHRRISAFSSGFRASSVELISKVQTSLALSVGEGRKYDTRIGAQGQILLRIGADLNWEKEEARWVREEQRWLREEQRWLREEARWLEEKQVLLEESTALKNQVVGLTLQLEELRSQFRKDEVSDASLRSLVSGMKTLLQALSSPASEDSLTLADSEKLEMKPIPRTITASESSAEIKTSVEVKPTVIVGPADVIAVVTSKEVPSKSNSGSKRETSAPSQAGSTSSTPQTAKETAKSSTPAPKKSRTLKTGMDGEDVKELQEALAEQGFYSGEEEIEFSMFSDGTESAVKTWQATLGVREDGQVTAELLANLLGGVINKSENKKKSEAAAEAPPNEYEPETRSSREIDRYERTNAQDTYGSQRRVYLLGENRWEEPDRLIPKKQETKVGHVNGMRLLVQKCFSCSGGGTMLCTECEGTGDLSVEEQFLEWVGEEATCPYCEGGGAVPCDVCDGQGVQAVKK